MEIGRPYVGYVYSRVIELEKGWKKKWHQYNNSCPGFYTGNKEIKEKNKEKKIDQTKLNELNTT